MNNKIRIKERIEEANIKALERMRLSRPILVDIRCARDILPQMKKNSIFHAGPPIDWQMMCVTHRSLFISASRAFASASDGTFITRRK